MNNDSTVLAFPERVTRLPLSAQNARVKESGAGSQSILAALAMKYPGLTLTTDEILQCAEMKSRMLLDRSGNWSVEAVHRG